VKKRHWVYQKIKIKELKHPILICPCGMKFLPIKPEIEMMYTRKKCFWCIPYQHNGKTPPLTHNYYPINLYKFYDK